VFVSPQAVDLGFLALLALLFAVFAVKRFFLCVPTSRSQLVNSFLLPALSRYIEADAQTSDASHRGRHHGGW